MILAGASPAPNTVWLAWRQRSQRRQRLASAAISRKSAGATCLAVSAIAVLLPACPLETAWAGPGFRPVCSMLWCREKYAGIGAKHERAAEGHQHQADRERPGDRHRVAIC